MLKLNETAYGQLKEHFKGYMQEHDLHFGQGPLPLTTDDVEFLNHLAEIYDADINLLQREYLDLLCFNQGDSFQQHFDTANKDGSDFDDLQGSLNKKSNRALEMDKEPHYWFHASLTGLGSYLYWDNDHQTFGLTKDIKLATKITRQKLQKMLPNPDEFIVADYRIKAQQRKDYTTPHHWQAKKMYVSRLGHGTTDPADAQRYTLAEIQSVKFLANYVVIDDSLDEGHHPDDDKHYWQVTKPTYACTDDGGQSLADNPNKPGTFFSLADISSLDYAEGYFEYLLESFKPVDGLLEQHYYQTQDGQYLGYGESTTEIQEYYFQGGAHPLTLAQIIQSGYDPNTIKPCDEQFAELTKD